MTTQKTDSTKESVKKNQNTLSQLVKSNPAFFSTVKPGELIEGKVIEKSSKRIVVDLGPYGSGVIYGGEIQNEKAMIKNLKVGDELHSKVVDINNEEGLIELSLAEAGKQKLWASAIEMKEREEIVTVKPIAANRGGLVVELNGLQAFLPASQLSNEHYPKLNSEDTMDKNQITESLQKLIGTEIKVKVLDVNLRNNKIILSEREAFEVSSKELAKNYSVGQVVEGIISGVADFGAFMRFADNPGLEGLIHVSEIDHKIIDNPKEALTVDAPIKAKIIDIKDGKIALSLKALKDNPYDKVLDDLKEGQEIEGTVYCYNPFGAIINISDSYQGYVHISEFGGLEDMKKKLTLKERYPFTITSIKPQEKRITLKPNLK